MPTLPPTLPTPPSENPQRGNPTTFSGLMDNFVNWITSVISPLSSLATNVYNNAMEAYDAGVTAVSAPGSNGTSTTNMAVALGVQNFTIQPGKAFVPGMYVVIAQTTAASTNAMYGQINSYDSGTGAIAVNVTNKVGTGTNITNWTISLSGGASISTTNITNNTTTFTGFKNKIRNPGMVFDQLYNGNAQTPTSTTMALDGWGMKISQASKLSFQRVADAPAGAVYSTKITVASSYTPLAGDIFAYYQRLEGIDVADLALGTASAKPIALSFWVKGSVAGTYALAFKNSAGNRVYVATFSVTTSWAQVSILLTGDTTGTWLNGEGVTGLGVYFDLGSGSTSNGTAGTWAATAHYNTSGSVKLVSQTAGATLNITNVELIQSSSASTQFEPLPYPIELERNLRFVEKSYELGTNPATATYLGAEAQHTYSTDLPAINFSTSFRVEKAVLPTITWYSPATGTAARLRNETTNADVTVSGTSADCPISRRGPGAPTSSGLSTVETATGHWVAKAELSGP